jgi:hypothetical protein
MRWSVLLEVVVLIGATAAGALGQDTGVRFQPFAEAAEPEPLDESPALGPTLGELEASEPPAPAKKPVPKAAAAKPDEAAKSKDPTTAELAEETAELAKGSAELGTQLKEVSKHLTVVTATTDVRIVLGGAVTADFLYNEARPVAPGTPFFLTPDSPFDFEQDTFDAHAKQTSLFALFSGPKVCGAETGGLILVNLYNDAVIVDRYGILPIQAWGEIKDEHSRFAAGLQLDIFNPVNPTILPFSLLEGSGNTGIFRGQARVEEYFRPMDDMQITLIGGISEPIPTTLSPDFDISEDNGFPNFESRIALAVGPLEGEGLLKQRPLEIGVSSVMGQIRTTAGATRVVADVWGVGADLRCALTDRFGLKGEFYVGETLGTYGGGILQNVNSNTFEGIYSSGGWGEVYYYWCPGCLHSHLGYGIDDPRDADLAPLQVAHNETLFVNLIWDVNKHLRFAGEATYRKTEYFAPLRDNEGLGLHTQVQWKF